jgi:hypothetical protein
VKFKQQYQGENVEQAYMNCIENPVESSPVESSKL